MHPFRSLLFVPGHKPGWVDKAIASGADAIVLDLEDSVPGSRRAEARAAVRRTVEAVGDRPEPVPPVFVRTNGLATGEAGFDLEAAVAPGLAGLLVPKVTGPDDLRGFDALVDHFERAAGVGGLEYVVPVETVEAVHRCAAIAAGSPRLGSLVGPTAEHADIARAIGFEWTPEGDETLYVRSRVLLACRLAGVHPVTALWERLDDLDGLREFATRGRRLGYRGMIAIHPSHVPVINEVFTPSATTVEFYRGLKEAYEAAATGGDGAVRYRDRHVDRAHYDKACEWLQAAARWEDER